MHIADQETGNLGANAIVGGSMGIATGAAMSAKWRASDQVAVCFFGEGALGQGLFYEVANMASLWKLPVIYVCENNLYNEYTHYSETTAGTLEARGRAFDLHTLTINGQDVREVYTTALDLVNRARRGDGPSLLICNTYRYHGHHVGDINREYYRPKAEEQEWRQERDPISLLENWLLGEAMTDQQQLDQITAEVKKEAEAALAFALDAPYPEPSEVDQHVYAV